MPGGKEHRHAVSGSSAAPRTLLTTSGHREVGQNNLEYVGLVVLVGAVIAAMAASGIGDRITVSFQSAICRVFTPAQACGPAPLAGSPTLTPLQRATQGDYVALGDSYSSGEGGSEFDPRTDEDNAWTNWLDENLWWPGDVRHNVCHRSTEAYPRYLTDEIDFQGEAKFQACSGATTNDFDSENEDNEETASKQVRPQLDRLDDDTSLVTLSVGGNDVGFAGVVTACVKQGLNPLGTCKESIGEQTRQDILDAKDKLVEYYEHAIDEAENARVVVVGYPRMFPENPTDDVSFIDESDQRWMNEMARLLNKTIREATAEVPGVEYVNVYGALDGHEIGTEDPWINKLRPGFDNGKPVDMGSFHPNDQGQAAIGHRVEQQVRNGG